MEMLMMETSMARAQGRKNVLRPRCRNPARGGHLLVGVVVVVVVVVVVDEIVEVPDLQWPKALPLAAVSCA